MQPLLSDKDEEHGAVDSKYLDADASSILLVSTLGLAFVFVLLYLIIWKRKGPQALPIPPQSSPAVGVQMVSLNTFGMATSAGSDNWVSRSSRSVGRLLGFSGSSTALKLVRNSPSAPPYPQYSQNYQYSNMTLCPGYPHSHEIHPTFYQQVSCYAGVKPDGFKNAVNISMWHIWNMCGGNVDKIDNLMRKIMDHYCLRTSEEFAILLSKTTVVDNIVNFQDGSRLTPSGVTCITRLQEIMEQKFPNLVFVHSEMGKHTQEVYKKANNVISSLNHDVSDVSNFDGADPVLQGLHNYVIFESDRYKVLKNRYAVFENHKYEALFRRIEDRFKKGTSNYWTARENLELIERVLGKPLFCIWKFKMVKLMGPSKDQGFRGLVDFIYHLKTKLGGITDSQEIGEYLLRRARMPESALPQRSSGDWGWFWDVLGIISAVGKVFSSK